MSSEFLRDAVLKINKADHTNFSDGSHANFNDGNSKLLDDMYKNWKNSHSAKGASDLKFGPTNRQRIEPFDFEMDPGFYGGREKIRERFRSEAILEHRLLQGDSYEAARNAAGMKGPYYPGDEEEARTSAKYNQALREGKGYQEARSAACMAHDSDPGFCGGEEKIVWHNRAYAWLKEYLRQGKDLSTAESMALTKIGTAPKR